MDVTIQGYDEPVEVSGKKLDSAARRQWVRERNSDRKKAGNKVSDLTHNRYFESIPVPEIDAILVAHGFSALEQGRPHKRRRGPGRVSYDDVVQNGVGPLRNRRVPRSVSRYQKRRGARRQNS